MACVSCFREVTLLDIRDKLVSFWDSRLERRERECGGVLGFDCEVSRSRGEQMKGKKSVLRMI